ncbi:MAG: acetylglutamate kinase [Calditrichaeota bacterium]|nr:acetylglutamate kinase [Calditrichota bacterium]
MKRRMLLKIGGAAFEGNAELTHLAQAINKIRDIEFVIVHGGGAEISQALKQANRGTEFIDGIRVTEAEDIQIVEHILSGKVNERIASALHENGVAAQRMSGKTDRLLVVEPLRRNGHKYGFVGTVTQVNPQAIFSALREGKVPVVSPISADEDGQSFNVNADSAAAALAAGAKCTDLVYFTNVPGVKIGEDTQAALSIGEAKKLIAAGIITGGMIAKMESIFDVLEHGVERVYIMQWQNEETLTALIKNNSINGTIIKR